jgi:ribonuclease P protein component
MTLGTQRYCLSRSMRMQQSRDFQRLKAEGQRLVHRRFIANWRRLPPGSRSRLGVVTSRRLGNAVERNRARRLLREAFRLAQHRLVCPVELVLVARSPVLGQSLADVQRDFLRFLKEASLGRVSS